MKKLRVKGCELRVAGYGLMVAGFGLMVAGCSSLQPATKSQSMTVTALGFPAITVVTTTSQAATNDGDDEGANTQTTSADVKPDVDASVVPTP